MVKPFRTGTQNPPPQGVPVRFRPRAPQIRPEASTSFRPFSFSIWEAALTSARTCAEVCRNPGVCGGTNGGMFQKSGGTSLHIPPARTAQPGALVLTHPHPSKPARTKKWGTGRFPACAPQTFHAPPALRIKPHGRQRGNTPQAPRHTTGGTTAPARLQKPQPRHAR